MVNYIKTVACAAAMVVTGLSASATTYSEVISGNDCGAGGLGACTLRIAPETEASALIKFGVSGNRISVDGVNSAFNGVSGELFSFSNISGGSSIMSFDWAFRLQDDSPLVLAVSVKAGPSWAWTSVLSFDEETRVMSGTLSSSDAGILVGRRNTPAISHVTFFGTESSRTSGQGETPPATNMPAVPLPAAAWLLLTALGGLAIVGRRKAKAV